MFTVIAFLIIFGPAVVYLRVIAPALDRRRERIALERWDAMRRHPAGKALRA